MAAYRRSQAFFETTRRLLAQLINESLSHATVEHVGPTQTCLNLHSPSLFGAAKKYPHIQVNLDRTIYLERHEAGVDSIVQPCSLRPPVTLVDAEKKVEEWSPGVIFSFIRPWFADITSDDTLSKISQELQNSAENQGNLSVEQKAPLTFDNPAIPWERTLVFGHRTHPFHRLCFAQPPPKAVTPGDIRDMITPAIAFISIPRRDLHLVGPFEKWLQPLLDKLEVPSTTRNDRVVVPCLAQQLPAVIPRFPNARIVRTIAHQAYAQASMRTISLDPQLKFGYHLKFPLTCQITSVVRTITPWTGSGPALSDILARLLPADLWLYRDIAVAYGSQEDFNDARHLSCILRKDVEQRAMAMGQGLVIAAAIHQKPQGIDRTYAEVLFGLKESRQKLQWLKSYVSCLFQLVFPPLVHHGIGMEVHGQNTVVRICRAIRRIRGFAVRDFGGIRLHTPTFNKKGIDLRSVLGDASILTDSRQEVWSKVHHAMKYGGWSIVRNCMSKVLQQITGAIENDVYEYFTHETMPYKCFLRMRTQEKKSRYRMFYGRFAKGDIAL
ncbi:IucC family-domain-containing protein [Aspergillus floccosus]